MKYNFDLQPNRLETECIKWHAYQPGVLPMWVADMDFLSPEPVIRALRQRIDHGVYGYPKENPCLREAFIDWVARKYGWKVQSEWIILIPGVVTGFNLATHAFAAPEGNVLIQPPVYPPFLHASEHAGVQRRDAPLTHLPDGSYAIDFDRFTAAIDDRTRMFILCNPHNPVGRVFSQDELERMAEICLARNVLICSDEIHCDLVFSGSRHIPIASLSPEVEQRSITLMAPSKTFNLAGLQCSFAIIPNPDLREQYQGARRGLVGWVNEIGQIAAEAAYSEGQEWLQQLMVYLEANRDFLFDFVQSELPGIKMARPEGTYLAWLDCRQAGIDGSPQAFFLEKAQVALNDGADFGPGGEGFVRLNFGCPRAMLEEALVRMKNALAA